MKTDHSKNVYISPRIETINVELEQGIAAGSAGGTTTNSPEQSWNKTDDINLTIDW
ncbi:hypothetical protein [Sphingobacterium thalpophilum]|uniref:hypothetical protein n=1 Tax=Sphingobacterium thalpophilum TaxID=259 RepID=UPI0024A67337|nr:hypothetical protein [Sphingobacterium thalpophilum]